MKKALFVILILVSALFAGAVVAADYFGYTKRGTFYEYPRAYGGYVPQVYTQYPGYYVTPSTQKNIYYPSDVYPARYYETPGYSYSNLLYRYGTTMPQRVVEQPSYIGFLDRVPSGAQEGQLCGVLQNKFYDCDSGLKCDFREKQIGVCIKPSMV